MVLHNLVDLQVHSANESTPGADLGTAFSGRSIRWVKLPVLQAVQAMLPNPSAKQILADNLAPILGLKNGSKLQFGVALRGTGTAAGASTAAKLAADLPENQLLANAFGGESGGTGTTCGVGSTTTEIVVAASSGFTVGQMVMINNEARRVTAKADATHITLNMALSGAPSASTPVYAAATYYPAESLVNTLQFGFFGATDGYYHLQGCQLDCKFANLNPGQLPQIDYDANIANWTHYTNASTLSPVTYATTHNAPVPGYASNIFLGAAAATTRATVNSSAIAIEPGIAFQPITTISSSSGTGMGIQAYQRTVIDPSITLTLNDYAVAYVTAFGAQTAYQIMYQVGTTAGQTVCIEAGNAVIDANPMGVNVNSRAGQQIKFKCLASSGSTELARAPIRIHLL